MPEATEVITCPACNHLLRVPHDWLGQHVQCPECQAMFKAPVRVGDTLTAPELISRPEPAAPLAPNRRWDVMLILPAFGLMVCGVVGIIADGIQLSNVFFAKDGGHEWAKTLVSQSHQMGFGQPGPEDAALEDQLLRFFRWFLPWSVAVSVGVFVGGLSMALQWRYRLAQVGCVLAIINVAGLCCLPGTLAGVWGLFMLASEEGRRHFRR